MFVQFSLHKMSKFSVCFRWRFAIAGWRATPIHPNSGWILARARAVLYTNRSEKVKVEAIMCKW